MHSSWKIGSVLHSSYIIILSHLSVRKPGGEAVSKGGGGIGGQVGSSLPLHTNCVIASLHVTSSTLKRTWTGKPEVIDPALVVASETG